AAGAAYAAARAAGKDATQAQQAADQAWAITAEKQSQERQAELAAEETQLQAEGKQLAEELKKELDTQIQAATNQAMVEYWRYLYPTTCSAATLAEVWKCSLPQSNKAPMLGGVPGLVSEWGSYFKDVSDEAALIKKVIKGLLGVDSVEECVVKKSAVACAEGAAGLLPAGKVLKLTQLVKRAKTVEEAAEASRIGRLAAQCLRPAHSFLAGTPVLMADGSSVPIERVRAGDYVLATDPVSGSTGPRRVDATIYTPDDRDFVDLTIQPVDSTTGTVTSTGTHPFWAQNQHAWRNAGDLTTGDTLRTTNGQAAQITATKKWTASRPAFDLTINEVHTYYVLAGTTPVLVHNSNPACEWAVPDIKDLDGTWQRMGFATRSDFGDLAWGGRTLSDASKLKTPEQVEKMRGIGMTRSDAQYWRNFYQDIHNKSAAKFPNNPEKVNPSAGSRMDLFQYYMDNLGD
ncbi:polymorphic toxin-type HINT domain-containing protein, partial [Kitasatospora sp. NPDC001574]